MRELEGEQILMRIFVGEGDRYDGRPLYRALVEMLREEKIAGATVLRGTLGFGANSRIHTAKILRLSTDLPVVVEIVDTKEKIEGFIPIIDEAISEGLATLEKVEIRFYRSGQSGGESDETPADG